MRGSSWVGPVPGVNYSGCDGGTIFESYDPTLPRLLVDSSDLCPISEDGILEYLQRELIVGERFDTKNLKFIRTALLNRKEHWIWEVTPAEGTVWFVIISRSLLSSDEEVAIYHVRNDADLTVVEQLMYTEAMWHIEKCEHELAQSIRAYNRAIKETDELFIDPMREPLHLVGLLERLIIYIFGRDNIDGVDGSIKTISDGKIAITGKIACLEGWGSPVYAELELSEDGTTLSDYSIQLADHVVEKDDLWPDWL